MIGGWCEISGGISTKLLGKTDSQFIKKGDKMKESFWMAITIVMTRLGVFRPYCIWIGKWLEYFGETTQSSAPTAKRGK